MKARRVVLAGVVGLLGGILAAQYWLFVSLGFMETPACRFRIDAIAASPDGQLEAQIIERECATPQGLPGVERQLSVFAPSNQSPSGLPVRARGSLERPGALRVRWTSPRDLVVTAIDAEVLEIRPTAPDVRVTVEREPAE